MEKFLEIRDLNVEFGGGRGTVKAVNHVSFQIEKGATIGLVGETGAGKTTTALSIMNLVPGPYGKIKSGQILFEGEDLLKKNEKEMRKIRGGKISMIFQDPMTSLNPVVTVGDQIAEVIKLHGKKKSRHEITEKAKQMLELVGIPSSRYEDYPHQFSGGMKQRVVIAIALACNPELLIADEPTTALDVTIQAQVLELMARLKKEFHTSMILITHDLGVVAGECDHVAIMYAGEIVEYGELKHIYKETKHPYTIGLFRSIPNIDRNDERLVPIPGLMPDPANLPAGCSFAPRCSVKLPECGNCRPGTIQASPGHYVKCWKVQKEVERDG